MATVSTITALLASFDSALTLRTAENLAVLFRGAVLASGPRTVSGCLVAAWPWAGKHWSAYGNVLRRAKIDLRTLARILFGLIVKLLPSGGVIELSVDESLVRRYGPRVVGVGMHRDAVRSGRGYTAVTPGHKWVIVSVLVGLPFARRALAGKAGPRALHDEEARPAQPRIAAVQSPADPQRVGSAVGLDGREVGAGAVFSGVG